jgi:hypothetical protein
MKITVRRFGGFAGLDEILADVDTTRLSPADRARVEGEIHDLQFFTLPSSGDDEPVGADFVRTEVTALDGAASHTVSYSDQNVASSSALRRFVDGLVDHPPPTAD